MSEDDLIELFDIGKIIQRSDPFRAWGHKITQREVRKAVAEGRLNPPYTDPYVGREVVLAKTKRQHIERIAWFVVNGWYDPIGIDVGVPSLWCHVSHIIVDGNHRVCAAVIKRDKLIRAYASGDLVEIAQFKPYRS